MNELTVKRTPETVGAEIRNLTAAARYMTVWYGVEIGRRLTEAKELVPYGGWLDFLKNETEFSQPTASRFMRIFSEYGAEQGSLFGAETKYSTLNNLSISNALRLLAVPEEERESFAQEVDAEHISTRELEEAIKARDEAHRAALEYAERLEKANAEAGAAIERAEDAEKKASELSEENDRLMENLADAEKQVKELESRPVDVAVQQPRQEDIDKAVAEAMAETEKAHAAEIEALKSNKQAEVQRADKLAEEKKKLAEQLAEAREKLKSADAGSAEEKKALSAEVENLRKQIAMSGAEVIAFKIKFSEWQEAYNAMKFALDCLDTEQRKKCAAAIKAVLEGWENG